MVLNLTETNIKKHMGCSYGYKMVFCYDDTYTKPVQIYRGEDSIKTFMQEMLKEVENCRKIISSKFKKPLRMSSILKNLRNAIFVVSIWRKILE